MSSEIATAVLAGLGGMLGWGLADFFAKKTIDKIGDVTTLFWGQFFGIFPLLILFLFNPEIPSFENNRFFYLAILGIWSAVSYIPTYIAFGKGKVSLLSPIFASYAVLVSIISATVFNEIIPINRLLASIFVFCGILLISGDLKGLWLIFLGRKREIRRIDGLREISIAVIAYSLWFIALDQFISGKNWVPILLGIRLFSSVTLFMYCKIKSINLRITSSGIWKFLILIGLFDVSAFASVSFGFSHTSFVSVVAMLSAAFSLPTMILAWIFLKERVERIQMIGGFVIIIGVMLLSLM